MDLPSGLRLHQNGTIYMNFRFLGQKIHRSTGTSDPEEAKELLYKTKEELLNGRCLRETVTKPEPSMSLGEAMDITWSEHYSKQKQAKTLITTFNVAKALMGHVPLNQVKRKTLLDFKEKLVKLRGISPATVNHYYGIINNTLRHMERVHDVDCSRVSIKEAVPKAVSVAVTDDIEKKLWQFLGDPMNFKRSRFTSVDATELFKVALLSGLRQGELRTFTVGQYRDGVITFEAWQHKTGGTSGDKEVPVSTMVCEILDERIKRLGLKPGDRVFATAEKDQLSRLVTRFRVKMDIKEPVRFHSLRHSFITRMVAAGAPLKQVSMMVGHSTVITTERYLHLTTQDLQSTLEKYKI